MLRGAQTQWSRANVAPPLFNRSGVHYTFVPSALLLVPVPSRRPERASCERLSCLEKPMLLSARGRTRELCLEGGAGCADCFVT